MNSLAYSFNSLCKKNPEGSYASQHNRSRMLRQMSLELQEMGYRHLTVYRFRRKHGQALVDYWDERGLAAGTVKNRMSALRWALKQVGRTKVLPPTNKEMGIPDRVYVNNKDKSVDPSLIQNIHNPYIWTSLMLCHVFGLRREEAMKLQPILADKGSYLDMKKTKNGRPRKVPIETKAQREVLDIAKKLAKDTPQQSLIPTVRYEEHLNRFNNVMTKHGIRPHGFRHGYAMRMYTALTGLVPPAQKGPSRKNLRGDRRSLDQLAQREIMRRLGHGDSRSISQYVGR